jgi:hypothetical protein
MAEIMACLWGLGQERIENKIFSSNVGHYV